MREFDCAGTFDATDHCGDPHVVFQDPWFFPPYGVVCAQHGHALTSRNEKIMRISIDLGSSGNSRIMIRMVRRATGIGWLER